MNLDERCERLLHHPAKPRARPLGPRLRQRRHVTDHIAEQDIGYLQMPRRSGTAAARLSTGAHTCLHASQPDISHTQTSTARRYQRAPSMTVLVTGGAGYIGTRGVSIDRIAFSRVPLQGRTYEGLGPTCLVQEGLNSLEQLKPVLLHDDRVRTFREHH